jgi:selenocysteine lyase/cysteine desulfurase
MENTEHIEQGPNQSVNTVDAKQQENKFSGLKSELEQSIYAALETYSNVHRGSGYKSIVTTFLYEQAREIVLDYLKLDKKKYISIFCTPRRAENLKKFLKPDSYQQITSNEIGLPIGIVALAVKRKDVPKGIPSESGGGTARVISKEWILWADFPDRFEAGTPAIISAIAFAKALLLVQKYGNNIFSETKNAGQTVSEILHNSQMDNLFGTELFEELRLSRIGKGIIVPTSNGQTTFINLDNSASTPTFVQVWDVYRKMLFQPMNVQQAVIGEVKSVCLDFVNAPAENYKVIFTSNTTEAINLATTHIKINGEKDSEPVILSTLLEHSSNDLPWRMVPNAQIIRLPFDNNGFINLQELENYLKVYNQEQKFGRKRIEVVALTGASNVLGTCTNLEEIGEIVHRYGAFFFVDAAQLVAHRKIDIEKSKIDCLVFSAHKAYAPFGCGVLIIKKELLNAGPDDLGKICTSGEENSAGIAALGKALILLKQIGFDAIHAEEHQLTAYALNKLSKIPAVKVHGIIDSSSDGFENKIGVIAFSVKGKIPHTVSRELAIRGGIGVRSGCHCAHITVKRMLNVPPWAENVQRFMLQILRKMNLPGVVRVSIGLENSREEIEKLISVILQITIKNQSVAGNKANYKIQIQDTIKNKSLQVYSLSNQR